jgi:hypothetical protein
MTEICNSYLIYYAENKKSELQGQVTSESMKCVKNKGNIRCGTTVGSSRTTPCSTCNHPIGHVKRIKAHERHTVVFSVLGDCCKADRWRVHTSMFVTRYSFGTLPQIITLLFFDVLCKKKERLILNWWNKINRGEIYNKVVRVTLYVHFIKCGCFVRALIEF